MILGNESPVREKKSAEMTPALAAAERNIKNAVENKIVFYAISH